MCVVVGGSCVCADLSLCIAACVRDLATGVGKWWRIGIFVHLFCSSCGPGDVQSLSYQPGLAVLRHNPVLSANLGQASRLSNACCVSSSLFPPIFSSILLCSSLLRLWFRVLACPPSFPPAVCPALLDFLAQEGCNTAPSIVCCSRGAVARRCGGSSHAGCDSDLVDISLSLSLCVCVEICVKVLIVYLHDICGCVLYVHVPCLGVDIRGVNPNEGGSSSSCPGS